MTTVRVDLGPRSYDCHIEPGLLQGAGAAIAALKPSRVLVVTNTTVAPLYGDALTSSIAAADARIPVSTIELPDGERYKTTATVESIYDAALDLPIDRRSVLVALGGGVVGDLTGFAAATLLRGVRFVMIPTTLLSQVDSSVGGKTGVDRPHGKNLVGAFHQPSLVLIDPATLASLPRREYLAGLAEVVKYGIILDAAMFEDMERSVEAILARDATVMTPLIARCVRIKADVVESDELETTGARRILNFGHTVAHALEQVTGYDQYLHGEAVAVGMVVAARLSARRGICSPAAAERIERLLTRLGMDTEVPANLDPSALMRAIALDKKADGARVAYIVCEDIGRCRAETLEVTEIAAAI
ncbi:MAG TPA: 3-dehydroquinate synthase [Candidatus Limnocylindrales bacterium]|nr:3-dehydroquinate synthase [Candidatus Limnocylindrales bacterium]